MLPYCIASNIDKIIIKYIFNNIILSKELNSSCVYIVLYSHLQLGKELPNFRAPRPGFSLFECYIQKINVLVFLMGQNPKCPGYNEGKNQGDKFKYIFDVYSFHHHLLYIFAQTRSIHQMLFQCWSTAFDAGPSLKQHWVIVPCFLTAAFCGWRFLSCTCIIIARPFYVHCRCNNIWTQPISTTKLNMKANNTEPAMLRHRIPALSRLRTALCTPPPSTEVKYLYLMNALA